MSPPSMFSRRAVASLLVLISGLNLVHIAHYVSHGRSARQAKTYSYYGHDFPETLPLNMSDLPLVSMTVEESMHYPLLGVPSDIEWFSSMSPGSGYVRLGPEDRMFVVTMFHELHCLRVLNLAFGKARFATPAHIKHCLNYLRQGILCAPDLTLEPGNFEEKDFEVERLGATHTCRDWSIVFQMMDENYYNWENSAE